MTMNFSNPGFSEDVVVDLGTLDLGSIPAISITAWGNVDAVGTADEQTIIAKGDATGASGKDWAIQFEESPEDIRGTINEATVDGGQALSALTWYFICLVYDGSDKTVWINAVVDATNAESGNVFAGSRPTMIAALNDNIKRLLDGLLDDIRLYSRALSQAEIETMFEARGVDGIVHGLEHRWPMNELGIGTAATIADSIIDLGPGQFPGDPLNSPVYAEGILRI